MTTTITRGSTLGVLARQEMRRYARSKLFWTGSGLLVAVIVSDLVAPSMPQSTTLSGIAPAALIGLVGISIMARLTRDSDMAAEVAGAVSVTQRTRTLALAAAVLVPVAAGLVWYATAIAGYFISPPDPTWVPIGEVSEADVFVVMFVQGVMPCATGPLLGLVVGRWLPRRWVPPVVSVVVVVVTIVMQPLSEAVEQWRLIWPWVHFYGTGGTSLDSDATTVFTGSPYLYLAYLVLLCVVGVLLALLKDPEADPSGTRRLIIVVAALAGCTAVAAMFGGVDERSVVPETSASVLR